MNWLPLTEGQADFWEEFVFHPDQPVSTVAHCLRFRGAVDAPALTHAIERTIAECETLALRFHRQADGRVLQRVEPDRAPRVIVSDLRERADPSGAARAVMHEDMNRPLDLLCDPLSAQMLLRTSQDEWLWYCRGHHIILDGYGMALIENRVSRLYAAAVDNIPEGEPLRPLAPFLREEARYADSDQCRADRRYWLEYLGSHVAALPVLVKGTEDYSVPPLRTSARPGRAIEDLLERAASATGLQWADLLTILTAVWLGTLDPARTGQPSPLAVWLPYMSRMGSLSARVPAMVVNIVPLLIDLPPGAPLDETLTELAATLRRHRRHGRYRVEALARDCGLQAGRRFHFTPLVNVMPFAEPAFAGLEVERQVLAAGPGDGFNVSFTATPEGRALICAIEAEQGPHAVGFAERAGLFLDWLPEALDRASHGGRAATRQATGVVAR